MSLSISKHIYKQLGESEALKELVSSRIFAISTKKETFFPFVLYRRSELTPNYTKDRYSTGDTATVEIVVASDNYLSSINISEIIRKLLEGKQANYDDFRITNAKLLSASEDFIEDTFIQQLVFLFETE